MRSLVFASFALFTGCGPLVTAEMEVEEICGELEPVSVQAAPRAVEGVFAFHARLSPPEELRALSSESELSLRLVRVELSADGVPDLRFLERAALRVPRADGTYELAAWTRDDTRPDVRLLPSTDADLVPLLTDGPVDAEAELEGTLPTVPWTLRTRTCYAVHANAAWSPSASE